MSAPSGTMVDAMSRALSHLNLCCLTVGTSRYEARWAARLCYADGFIATTTLGMVLLGRIAEGRRM